MHSPQTPYASRLTPHTSHTSPHISHLTLFTSLPPTSPFLPPSLTPYPFYLPPSHLAVLRSYFLRSIARVSHRRPRSPGTSPQHLHVTPHTSHVTHHTSHITRHTSLLLLTSSRFRPQHVPVFRFHHMFECTLYENCSYALCCGYRSVHL